MLPPDESVQKTYMECDKALNFGKKHMRESCECLKDAGLDIDCNIPRFP